MRQGNLFAPPAQPHSATSVAAAEGIVSQAPRLRRRVYEWLLARGPAGGTDEEGALALGMPGNTFRPRRVELVFCGDVSDSGTVRKTRAGRKATVWVARVEGAANGRRVDETPCVPARRPQDHSDG